MTKKPYFTRFFQNGTLNQALPYIYKIKFLFFLFFNFQSFNVPHVPYPSVFNGFSYVQCAIEVPWKCHECAIFIYFYFFLQLVFD